MTRVCYGWILLKKTALRTLGRHMFVFGRLLFPQTRFISNEGEALFIMAADSPCNPHLGFY